ncbi:MAG: hypothetical protein D6812_08925 [Deltaproteobacteria bacterium]|nr:MAG: hypothetical protein D6812_08925 [Deltaproteobacteria bacterium]
MNGISKATLKAIGRVLLVPWLLLIFGGCGQEGVILGGEQSGGTAAQTTGIVGIVLDEALDPVANATIGVPAYGRVVLSGKDGRFSLGVLPRGAHRLQVSGEAAFGGECSTSFADLYVSEAPYLFPILLACVPPEGGEVISTVSGGTLSDAAGGDAQIEIFAGTTLPETALSMSEVTFDPRPHSTPKEMEVISAVALFPAATQLDIAARLRVPNRRAATFPPDLFYLDPVDGETIPAGRGELDETGETIENVSGGVTRFGTYLFLGKREGEAVELQGRAVTEGEATGIPSIAILAGHTLPEGNFLFMGRARTDAQGRYTLRFVPVEERPIEVVGISFLDGAVEIRSARAAPPPTGVDRVTMPDLRFVRPKGTGGEVYGSLLDETRNPFAGLPLTLKSRVTQTRYQTLSDREGNFLFEGIPAGPFVVEATLEGKVGRAEGEVAEGERTRIELVVRAAASLSVVSTAPAEGERGVALDVTPSVTFSAPIDPATVTPDTLFLLGEGGPLSGTIRLSPEGTRLSLRPDRLLVANEQYRFVVGNAIRDMSGNALEAPVVVSFTTIDTIAPLLLALTPADGIGDVPLSVPVEARFSEPIDPFTVTPESFSVTEGGGRVVGSFRFSSDGREVRFLPEAEWTPATVHTVRLTREIRDLAGNALPAEVTTTFTTLADEVRPTVVEIEPAEGSEEVETEPIIRVTFSEPLSPITVDVTSFCVVLLPEVGEAPCIPTCDAFVPGTITVRENATEATLVPRDPLEANAHYQISLTRAITDRAGNPLVPHCVRFATITDRIPPEVVETFPISGARGVEPPERIEITFSEPVDPDTVTPDHFIVSFEEDRDEPLAGTIDTHQAQAFFTPDDPFSEGRTIRFELTAGITDPAGNALVPFIGAFSTKPDTTPPELVEIEPLDGAEGVAVDVEIRAVFSEAIDPATLPGAVTLTTGEGEATVAGTLRLTEEERVLRFTPLSELAEATRHRFTISTAVTDAAGNPLAEGVEIEFTTEDGIPPAVLSVDPPDGATDVPPDVTIHVTFSEPIDETTLTPASVRLTDPDGREVARLLHLRGETLDVVPLSPLEGETTHTLQLAGTITDRAGNALEEAFSSTFTTGEIAEARE